MNLPYSSGTLSAGIAALYLADKIILNVNTIKGNKNWVGYIQINILLIVIVIKITGKETMGSIKKKTLLTHAPYNKTKIH